jgi:hypothetical protein
MQYYGAHLERAGGVVETLLPLVSNGWRQAWERLEGAYAGFLSNVSRAWCAVERTDRATTEAGQLAPYFGDEVRCALCQASIQSLAANASAELLEALVIRNIWSFAQGLTYTRQIPNAQEKTKALTALASHLHEGQQPAVWQEALQITQAIEEADTRAQALIALAPVWSLFLCLIFIRCGVIHCINQHNIPALLFYGI